MLLRSASGLRAMYADRVMTEHALTKPSHLPDLVRRTLRLSYTRGLGSAPGRHQPIEVDTMNKKSPGKSRATVAVLLMTGVAALGSLGTSHAGCADVKWSDARLAAFVRDGEVSPLMNTTPGTFVRVADSDSPRSIVGLWKFEMIS